jgi:hypothetical protein
LIDFIAEEVEGITERWFRRKASLDAEFGS